MLLEIHKIGFRGNKTTYKAMLSGHLQLILTSYVIYTSLFSYTTEFLLVFDADLKHMGAWSRGNRTNFDWLR